MAQISREALSPSPTVTQRIDALRKNPGFNSGLFPPDYTGKQYGEFGRVGVTYHEEQVGENMKRWLTLQTGGYPKPYQSIEVRFLDDRLEGYEAKSYPINTTEGINETRIRKAVIPEGTEGLEVLTDQMLGWVEEVVASDGAIDIFSILPHDPNDPVQFEDEEFPEEESTVNLFEEVGNIFRGLKKTPEQDTVMFMVDDLVNNITIEEIPDQSQQPSQYFIRDSSQIDRGYFFAATVTRLGLTNIMYSNPSNNIDALKFESGQNQKDKNLEADILKWLKNAANGNYGHLRLVFTAQIKQAVGSEETFDIISISQQRSDVTEEQTNSNLNSQPQGAEQEKDDDYHDLYE